MPGEALAWRGAKRSLDGMRVLDPTNGLARSGHSCGYGVDSPLQAPQVVDLQPKQWGTRAQDRRSFAPFGRSQRDAYAPLSPAYSIGGRVRRDMRRFQWCSRVVRSRRCLRDKARMVFDGFWSTSADCWL